MSAAKIMVAIQRADSEIGAAIGTRAFHADSVPRGTSRPYTAYRIESHAPDRDLNNRLGGYTVSILVDVVGDEYADVEAILLRFPLAMDAVQGTTVTGFSVTGAEAADTGDEITGPVDIDGGTAYIGTVQVNFYYEV